MTISPHGPVLHLFGHYFSPRSLPSTTLSISPLFRDGDLCALCAIPVVRIVLRRQQAAAEVLLEPLSGGQVRVYDAEPAPVDPDLLPDAEVPGGVDVSPGGGASAGAVLPPPPTCSR